MENGVKIATTEGSPQGDPVTFMANVYLNEFDWEYERRGVPVIRYADDIVLLCKSQKSGGKSCWKRHPLSGRKLKLRVNGIKAISPK